MNNDRRKELNAKRIATLDLELIEIAELGIEELEEMGWRPYCVQALRTMDEQAALFAQGRESLDAVNALRKKVGWDNLEAADNKIVTRARPGASKHNFGKAFDIVNIDDEGNVEWENESFYDDAETVFCNHGLTWGGSWKNFQDQPHFELS